MHGGAAKHVALAIEQVAVRRVGAEELRHLVDEPLEHDVELELAGHDLRGMQEGSLLRDAATVLGEQRGRTHRRVDLVAHRLDEVSLPPR